MAITSLPVLNRASASFKSDVDLFFSTKLPTMVSEINAMVSGGVSNVAMTGFRNKIHNGNFLINQRAVSGTVVLAAYKYGHDRWRAGADGCTYTVSKVNNVTTLTITAGSLKQVIEGADIQSGNYVLGWNGTATGRTDFGSYAASPVKDSFVGGNDVHVEFGVGTLSFPQFEYGTTRTVIDTRPYGIEDIICKRFYYQLPLDPNGEISVGQALTSTSAYAVLKWPVQMRASPTITLGGSAYRLGGEIVGAFSSINTSPSGASFNFSSSITPFVVSGAVLLVQSATPAIPVYAASAEL